MSARAISRWLAEGPKVKLSAVSIAKALRSPDQMDSLYEYKGAVRFLNDHWFSLDNSIRDNCWRFFQPKDEEEKSE